MSASPRLPRVRPIDRTTVSSASLDEQLPPDHPVRLLWAFVQAFDWSPWYARIRVVHGGQGASAIAPELLFALWLLATTEGVASSRELSELCGRDLPYQWLCGGEPVNYWTLNHFYTANQADLDRLFVEHIAALRQQGLICLQRVTLDGRKIIASASKVTDTQHGLIVTVKATSQGSDNGLLQPMLEQVRQEQGVLPCEALLDKGYSDAEDVEALERQGVHVYMPPRDERKDQKAGRDPYAPKRRDTPKVATWRARMGTPEARVLYRQRAPIAEGVHAQEANRDWRRCRLRGVERVEREARWQALAQNWCRLLALGVVTSKGTVRAVAA